MDKVISTRVDESVAQLLDALSRELRLPKKRILEEAIRLYGDTVENRPDIFELTCGAWRRDETSEQLHKRIRTAFRASMTRHTG